MACFSCLCPKVMAAIGRLPETLADRCIVIRMQRKTAQEKCERLRDLYTRVLRRQCARFVSDQASAVAEARPEIPSVLNDRAGDIWEPLLALADLAGGPWSGLARQAACHLSAAVTDSNPIGALLLDLFVAFRINGTDRLTSRAVVDRLNALADRPWAHLSKGRPVTDQWVAPQLRRFGWVRIAWIASAGG